MTTGENIDRLCDEIDKAMDKAIDKGGTKQECIEALRRCLANWEDDE